MAVGEALRFMLSGTEDNEEDDDDKSVDERGGLDGKDCDKGGDCRARWSDFSFL